MTDQEKFEQWFEVRFNLVSADWHISGEFAKAKANIRMGYLAAKQDSSAEIETLKHYHAKWCESNAKLALRDLEIVKLREALVMIADESAEELWQGEVAREALASTPAQSLQAHDDEMIERCVVVGSDRCETTTWSAWTSCC